ncbi:hypothetical protein FD06_GL000266 [Apilactobacillus ozensis DSM 23829 = JCM 17196]|uniref:Uncharacterized protein n=1 Tax=Apilactobacillus ozensis DSM 23829 = JCM 17196 TaxID=1423781 RepID=A0A0R2AQT4_9LACO|nr:hypothetical protein [Apilactobacillus ozensis]KRM69207.1 hypothetical protein FD06_GL000266 [Apilactobacillus ozensis DSM 23829 = JCM 17196]
MKFNHIFSKVKKQTNLNKKFINSISKSINDGEKAQKDMENDYQKHKAKNEKILSMFK